MILCYRHDMNKTMEENIKEEIENHKRIRKVQEEYYKEAEAEAEGKSVIKHLTTLEEKESELKVSSRKLMEISEATGEIEVDLLKFSTDK